MQTLKEKQAKKIKHRLSVCKKELQRKEEKTSENEIRKKLKIERIFFLREKIHKKGERERGKIEKKQKTDV